MCKKERQYIEQMIELFDKYRKWFGKSDEDACLVGGEINYRAISPQHHQYEFRHEFAMLVCDYKADKAGHGPGLEKNNVY